MINKIKTLLGDAAAFTDAQIELCVDLATAEIESYCNRSLDKELELVALQIAKIKLNRLNTEGLASQGYSGTTENYIDGYPKEIQATLNRKRKVKVL